jgi:hypothetical protein
MLKLISIKPHCKDPPPSFSYKAKNIFKVLGLSFWPNEQPQREAGATGSWVLFSISRKSLKLIFDNFDGPL